MIREPQIGDLLRPIVRYLSVHTVRGEVTLNRWDVGVLTYYNPVNTNIEVLCRGQVCQSSSLQWRPVIENQ